MAAETAANGPTAGAYIQHHLHHLQKNFSFETVTQKDIIDFSIFNLDSVVWSILLGALGCWLLWLGARKATSGVPGRFQAAVEIMSEMVENQAKGVIHNAKSRKLVSPLALTVFVWIFLMNAMDLLPVDLIPTIWHSAGPAMGEPDVMRFLPTADLSTTLGLSVSVLIVCLVYNVKMKGAGGWAHELVTAPFGANPLLWPINFLMQIIEFVAKTVSHGMRLFGNMFAGELVFMLIALMGGKFLEPSTPHQIGSAPGIGRVKVSAVGAALQNQIITLQAFIFMMLTLIYVGQAHDAH